MVEKFLLLERNRRVCIDAGDALDDVFLVLETVVPLVKLLVSPVRDDLGEGASQALGVQCLRRIS